LTEVKQWVANPGNEQLVANQFPDILGLSYFGVYCTVHESFKHSIEFINLTTARFELAAGNARAAIKILDTLLGGAVQQDKIFFKTQVLIFKALALQKAGEDSQAVAILLTAIKLIAPEPFFQIFFNQGNPLYNLLKKVKNSLDGDPGITTENAPLLMFIEQILAQMSVTQQLPLEKPVEPGLFELTPREIEVLTWLAEGMSYAEIAKKLMISKNTVKTHLKRVFSKLEVTNRLQAVNKAKSLGLFTGCF
jgi:LuxR family maltose regulon positive regulatory protein